ncbi:MAG: aldo/keto reductase [Lachnospiraceae bacterium]|nr:aldo/keto reductase [Lachnospiraceae bacterium]
MKKIPLSTTQKEIPVIAAGCMRIDSLSLDALCQYIETYMEAGINFFDHADIYGGGICEELFGKAFLKTGIKREDVIIQSKCGIVPGVMYDFSKDYILKSVDSILQRLQMDYLDILLLHRPDALMEPEEVAAAFDILETSGKVLHFGVSNQKPMQIELLQKYTKQKLIINQLQFSIPVSNMIASGMEVNMQTDGAIDRDGSILDYCRLHDITIQTWSPFQYGFFEGVFIGSDKYPTLNALLDKLAEKYNVTPTTIASAWILRHPAKMQLISGSTSPQRIKEIAAASDITLTREEWYQLYLAAGHILP